MGVSCDDAGVDRCFIVAGNTVTPFLSEPSSRPSTGALVVMPIIKLRLRVFAPWLRVNPGASSVMRGIRRANMFSTALNIASRNEPRCTCQLATVLDEKRHSKFRGMCDQQAANDPVGRSTEGSGNFAYGHPCELRHLIAGAGVLVRKLPLVLPFPSCFFAIQIHPFYPFVGLLREKLVACQINYPIQSYP